MFEHDNLEYKPDRAERVATLNVIRLDLRHHQVFLSLTPGFENGPPIQRSGTGSPYMYHVGSNPADDENTTTTNAFGLRLGSWLVRESLRVEALVDAIYELARLDITDADRIVLRETVEELLPDDANNAEAVWVNAKQIIESTGEERGDLIGAISFAEMVLQRRVSGTKRPELKAHAEEFLKMHPGWVIIAQQGNGDLTMNYWNVCFVNDGKESKLLYLNGEPVSDRTYSCLIKWKKTDLQPAGLSIEEVRFQPYPGRNPHRMVWVRNVAPGVRGKWSWVPCGDRIEFAASNQQIIHDGQVVELGGIIDQFSDLRHVLRMPNLNPTEQLVDGEPRNEATKSYRPRSYYGQRQYGEVWLGEELFLRDTNARRLALSGSVVLDFPPGADAARLRGALKEPWRKQLANEMQYKEIDRSRRPSSSGEWRFEWNDPQTQRIDVYFRRNIYPWTIVGLTKDQRTVVCLACTANHPRGIGWTIEEAAKYLVDQYRVHNALLIDEGMDVFQSVWPDGYSNPDNPVQPKEPVGRKRSQMRSTLVFAKLNGKDGAQ